MGLFRKAFSVSTLGAVDFQSDKERIARSARLTKQAMRKQNSLIQQQTAQIAVSAATPSPSSQLWLPASAQKQVSVAPPGLYLDPNGQSCERWWTGRKWSEFTRNDEVEAPPEEQS
jgi:hypothetical protein